MPKRVDPKIQGATSSTSSTVTNGLIRITAPAVRGQRVYLIQAGFSTDSNGATNRYFVCQDMGKSLSVTDAVTTATSTAITSAGNGFAGMDLFYEVTGTGMAADTWLEARSSGSAATINPAATASGTVTLTFTGTPVFAIKGEPRSTGKIGMESFRPPLPLPISSEGSAARFVLRVDTTGQLAVTYGYGQ